MPQETLSHERGQIRTWPLEVKMTGFNLIDISSWTNYLNSMALSFFIPQTQTRRLSWFVIRFEWNKICNIVICTHTRCSTIRICLQCGRPRFDAWVGKIPWRRKWQSSPVFLSREFHGQRSLVGYSPWGCKELDTNELLSLLPYAYEVSNHFYYDTKLMVLEHCLYYSTPVTKSLQGPTISYYFQCKFLSPLLGLSWICLSRDLS